MPQIDFFTLGAQMVNFLLLAYLLRRFLFSRIVKIMDRREKSIASRLQEAESKMQRAREAERSYLQLQQELSLRREEILAQAGEEARRLRQELADKARAEVEETRARWYDAIEREKADFLRTLRRRSAEQVFSAARRVLRDLANDELERHIILAFLGRLEQMKEVERAAAGVAPADRRGVLVSSAFEIPLDMRERISGVLRKQAGDVPVQFEVVPDLVSGVELTMNDVRIRWTLEGYLDSLEEELSRAIGRKTVRS